MPARVRATAVVGLAVLLAACGGASDTQDRSDGGPRTSTSTPTPPTAIGHTPLEAAALVETAHDSYAGATISTPLLGNCFWPETGRPCPIAVSTVMTADLIAGLDRVAHEGTGIDPVERARNYPVRVSHDPPVEHDRTVLIVVHASYGSPPALQDQPIRVTVELETLELSDLTCPSPS